MYSDSQGPGYCSAHNILITWDLESDMNVQTQIDVVSDIILT